MERNVKNNLIDLKEVVASDGNLVVTEVEQTLPFPVKRVFWIFNTPDKAVRADHASKNSDFVLICLNGQLTVELDNGKEKEKYHLNSSNVALYIPRMVWMRVYDFSENAILLVLASEKYAADQYCEDYNLFLKEKC